MARPTKYSEQILDLTKQYIDEAEDTAEVIGTGLTARIRNKVKLPTLEGLAFFLRVHKDTIQEWKKNHDEFSVLIGDLLAKQAEALINNGLSGNYNPTIAKVLLAKHGYKESTEVDQNVHYEMDFKDVE